jgi:hypothetical protein
MHLYAFSKNFVCLGSRHPLKCFRAKRNKYFKYLTKKPERINAIKKEANDSIIMMFITKQEKYKKI